MVNEHTLRDLLTTGARRYEKKTFLEHGDRRFSFRSVDDRTDRVATGLIRAGLRPGDRVALLLSNSPEAVFYFLGAAKIGMVPVPIEPAWSQDDVMHALRQTEVSSLVAERRHLRLALGLAGGITRIRVWILAGEDAPSDPPFQALPEGPVLGFWPDLDPGDAAVILRTRGTTGAPKAVVLSHRNLASNCLQAVVPFRVDETDRFYCALPLSSVTALVLLLLTPWTAGAACILSDASSPGPVLEDLARHRISVMAGMPHLFAGLVDLEGGGSRDLGSLRLGICKSGPVDSATLRTFEDRYEAFIVEGYGLVEAAAICCANPYTGVRKPGSVGLPLPGEECRVVDARGRDCAPGETGDILVRGPNIMKGYYNDPAASARVLRAGWLHTGDLGCIDHDGYYYLKGRKEP